MNYLEQKKEQERLVRKRIVTPLHYPIKTIGAAECIQQGKDLIACIIVCNYPNLEVIKKTTYILHDALAFHPEYIGSREMPALIEAFNHLDEDPDVVIIKGTALNHPRRCGVGVYLGLALQKPTFSICENNIEGEIQGEDMIHHGEKVGFIYHTREHSNPIFISPAHLIDENSIRKLLPSIIRFPHKMPEPLHLVHKLAKNTVKNS